MGKLVTLAYVLVGIIHILPVTGVFGPQRLRALYDVSITEPNLLVLMRHRAVLFGIVGGLMIYAAMQPKLRDVAFVCGLVSMVSFIGVAFSADEFNGHVRRVLVVDVVATLALLAAFGAERGLGV